MITNFLNDILYFPYIPGLFTTSILLPWAEGKLVIFYYILTILITIIIVLSITYIIRYLITKFFPNRFKLPNFVQYLSLLFLLIPVLNIIYPILLGVSKNKINKQLKFIITGTIFSCFYIFSKMEMEYDSLSFITIIPLLSLLLLSINIKNKYVNIFLKIISFLILGMISIPEVYEYVFWKTKI